MSSPPITQAPTQRQTCPPVHPNDPTWPRSTMTKPNQSRDQNQIHTRTHFRRLKVYSSCLACRKKKIKCDGLPTCKRCELQGFECSYIDDAQIPRPNAKHSMDEASHQVQQSAPTSFAQDCQGDGGDGGGGHQGTTRTKTCKKLRQQRRSSTKDAVSGPFPYTALRRKNALDLTQMDKSSSGVQPSDRDMIYVETTLQQSRLASAFVVERDKTIPDLYRILANSVTIPNVATCMQGHFSSPLGLMGMGHLNFASSDIPTVPAMNQDHADLYGYHSCFEKEPAPIPDQSTLPGFSTTDNTVIQCLVHAYFECFHGCRMIVDKDKFLVQLYDPLSPPDPLLLVAICAAGAKYSDNEGLCAEPGNRSTIGDQFLTHARILLQDRFDVPSVSTLQALLIMYWCQVQAGRASLQFMYLGMAIRMAQELGLNRPMDPKRLKEMDNREVQILKTIWWSCYQADRWTSATLDKPMSISDIDCVVDYPSSVDASDDYGVQSFNHMTDLAKILGEVTLNLYISNSVATCSSAVFSRLDQSLSTWVESLPSTSESDQTTDGRENIDSNNPKDLQGAITSANAAEYCALLFHTVRIMLHRPFLYNSALTPLLPMALQSPQNRCRESALAISKIAENMATDQKSHRQLFNSIHFSLCTAATVHRFFVISSPKPSDDASKEATDPSQALWSSPATATLSKAPPSDKTDLCYLALLLRILKHCCRFSVEKNLLHSILDNFIPLGYLDLESISWIRNEILKPVSILPFSFRIPLQQQHLQQDYRKQEQGQDQSIAQQCQLYQQRLYQQQEQLFQIHCLGAYSSVDKTVTSPNAQERGGGGLIDALQDQ